MTAMILANGLIDAVSDLDCSSVASSASAKDRAVAEKFFDSLGIGSEWMPGQRDLQMRHHLRRLVDQAGFESYFHPFASISIT
jgi:hypothetical protein